MLTGGYLMSCRQPYNQPTYAAPNPDLPPYSTIPGVKQARPQTIYKQLRCNSPGSKEEYELCQPWHQAEAAYDAACTARWQFYGGAFGLVLILATFLANAVAGWGAKQAADAAKEAVRVSAAAERPHFLLTELSASGLLQPANAQGQVDLTLAFTFQNFGRSPAFLRGIANSLNYDAALPAVPTYPAALVVPHIIAPVNGIYYRAPTAGLLIPQAAAAGVAAGNRSLHFFGTLKYDDVLGKPHVIRYCYRLVFQGNDATIAFRPAGPPSYWEYT